MPNKEQKQELVNKAYELRLRGKSYRQIGEEMGISYATAFRYVTSHLENITLPLVDEVRKTEVDRMMRYLDSLEDKIDEGDVQAVNTAIKVSERLCKMLGIDQPTKTEVTTVESTPLDSAIQGLLDEMADRNAAAKRAAAMKGETDES